MCTEQWFDVTPYEAECWEVKRLGPLLLFNGKKKTKTTKLFSNTLHWHFYKVVYLLFVAIDEKCLKNKYTEKLVKKDYFKKWIAIQTKISTPFMLVCFLWEVFKISTFGFFDSMLVWYENDLVNSGDDTSANASCVQHWTSFIEERVLIVGRIFLGGSLISY